MQSTKNVFSSIILKLAAITIIVPIFFVTASKDEEPIVYKPVQIILTSDAPNYGENTIVNVYIDERLTGTISKTLTQEQRIDFLRAEIIPDPETAVIYTIKKERVRLRYEVVPSEYPDYLPLLLYNDA